MKRTAKDVVDGWRASVVNNDDGELVSRINYWAVTDFCLSFAPGLGSGALREALEQIASITCSCHDSANADWHGKRCPKGIALAALSLSSPIEPPPEPVIRCRDCGATLMWAKTAEGYEVIHSCKDGKQVREMFAAAQASSEIRERPNLLSSIPLATGRDSATSGWTVDPAFLVRELLSGDERPDLEAIEAVVLVLNQLQTKRALTP